MARVSRRQVGIARALPYTVGQTLVVVAWIIVNSLAVAFRWDPYPFILLNLAFSTQAAYAAPLILLAQTRQAERDKDDAPAAAVGDRERRRCQHTEEERERARAHAASCANARRNVSIGWAPITSR